ncbi:hypothetical protein EZS27_022875 [termite gut metagenome]|uniref:Uncharacterized protein n=1 Tax=termite gut metagenome TaxID=433724 RepID=A0A5J4R3V6_9ZZZZ
MPCSNSRFPDYPFFDTVDVQNYHYVGGHPPLYRADCKFNYSFIDFTSMGSFLYDMKDKVLRT